MGVTDLFSRITASTGLLLVLLYSAAFLVGLVAAFVGMKKIAGSGGLSMGDANARERQIGFILVIGSSLMLALPAMLEISGQSLFDKAYQNPGEIFAYAPRMTQVFTDNTSRTVLTTLVFIVQFVGALAVFRSFNLLMKAPYHPGRGLYGRAMTHLIGGALAWNIVAFMEPLEQLLLG